MEKKMKGVRLPTMSRDGEAHVAYFDAKHGLSYVWDGHSSFIEVSEGGYAEPVVGNLHIPHISYANPSFPVATESVQETLRRFRSLCMIHAAGWPSSKDLLVVEEDDE